MAYTSSVQLAMPHALRIRGTNWGFVVGTVDITEYHATTSEETDITKHFKAYTVGGATYKCYVTTEAVTDNGYNVGFDPTTGKFKAWRESGTGSGARTEAANGDDIGAFQFKAEGLVGP